MTSQQFFLMIKPDGVKRGLVGEIIARFEKRGFFLEEMRLCKPEAISRIMEDHYKAHEEMNFYDALIEFNLSGPIIAMIWMGNVQVARGLVGDTIPWDSKPGTIRGDLASSLIENLIHCSATPEAASREVALWRQVFN